MATGTAGDLRVQLLPSAAQQVAVSRVLHQRVRNTVVSIALSRNACSYSSIPRPWSHVAMSTRASST